MPEEVMEKWGKIPHLPYSNDIIEYSPKLYRYIVAKRALLAGYGEEVDDPETLMIDILADFRHLCDVLGLNFAEIDRAAYRHYSEENYEWRKEHDSV